MFQTKPPPSLFHSTKIIYKIKFYRGLDTFNRTVGRRTINTAKRKLVIMVVEGVLQRLLHAEPGLANHRCPSYCTWLLTRGSNRLSFSSHISPLLPGRCIAAESDRASCQVRLCYRPLQRDPDMFCCQAVCTAAQRFLRLPFRSFYYYILFSLSFFLPTNAATGLHPIPAPSGTTAYSEHMVGSGTFAGAWLCCLHHGADAR